MFEGEEKPLLRPLPVAPFEISRWFYRRVQKNGHVVFERNFYSVPYAHIGSSVDLRVTDTTLEVFAAQERLSSHLLAPVGVANEYRTRDGDLLDGPRCRQRDAERVREWAGRIGEHTKKSRS